MTQEIKEKIENQEDKKATAELFFGKDNTLKPDRFNFTTTMGVTITLRGKIVSYSNDANPWDKGMRIKLEVQSCDIEQEKNIDSLSAAVENANETRRIV